MQRNLFPIDRFHLQETGVMVSYATVIFLLLFYYYYCYYLYIYF